MALPPNLGDREVQKFVEDSDSEVAVRTTGESIIRDADGNKATVGSWSKALAVHDQMLHSLFHEMLDVMKQVRDQLCLITDEDVTVEGDQDDL